MARFDFSALVESQNTLRMQARQQANRRRHVGAVYRVAMAVAALKAEGRPVTVRNVKEISGGSHTTIVKALQELRSPPAA